MNKVMGNLLGIYWIINFSVQENYLWTINIVKPHHGRFWFSECGTGSEKKNSQKLICDFQGQSRQDSTDREQIYWSYWSCLRSGLHSRKTWRVYINCSMFGMVDLYFCQILQSILSLITLVEYLRILPFLCWPSNCAACQKKCW